MKNLLPIIAFLIQLSLANGQEVTRLPSYIQISDTVKVPALEEYYLVDISKLPNRTFSVARVVNSKFAIVRGLHPELTKTHPDYYSLDASWKLSPRLLSKSQILKTELIFSLKYSENIDAAFLTDYHEIKIIRILEKGNIALVSSTFEFILSTLMHDSRVEFIDVAKNNPVEESPIRQYCMDLNGITSAWHYYPDVDGEGIYVSVKENSIYDDDIDLQGKVTINEFSSELYTQHAKEMGTLIAGQGNTYHTGLGVASGAKLACTDFKYLFAEDSAYYDQFDITIQNHSYGTGIENYYGNESISYDQSVVDRPELVHIFSAGNSGQLASTEGPYAGMQGFANLTGTYKQAKNVLVIATLDSAGNAVDQSSAGPAFDGRLKPELAAFGGEGSSESAALASGCAALIQDHYLSNHPNPISSSLLKSVLISGADDAYTTGIDYKTGYGSINLSRSLEILDSGWYFVDTIKSNSMDSMQIRLDGDIAEFKIVLSWIDPPANPMDAKALVNDLDLLIRNPAGELILPWILQTNPEVDLLSADATRGQDHINNTELISVEIPPPGLYAIKVMANELKEINQQYSIAYYIRYGQKFKWTYPTSSDRLQAGSRPYFRWENSFPAGLGNVQIRYGNGPWETLGDTDISHRQFKSTLKDTTCSAILRMTISGVEYLSDTFTISQPPEVHVENDCANELVLSWNKIQNATQFELYDLKNDILVPFLITPDTSVRINKSEHQGNFYAVQPMLAGDLPGLRSRTVNYLDFNSGCYLSNFLVYLSLENNGEIRLLINLQQDIRQIAIFKEFGGATQIFTQFIPDTYTEYQYTDTDLEPGKTSYFTELELVDGTKILSDTLGFFYTDPQTIIVFPNPSWGEIVNVLHHYPGSLFELTDLRGAVVKQVELSSTVDEIDLSHLAQGLYVYRIISDGNLVNTGKIVRL